MTENEVLQKIKDSKPKLIYISGKTSTGKTTFSNSIRDFYGYSVIRLGSIIFDSIIKPFSTDPMETFVTVYRDTEPKKYVDIFIATTRSAVISQLKSSPVVVEGAIAKTRILKEIFKVELKDFMFIYFHPINRQKYAERIRGRFLEGAKNNTTELPKLFWSFISQVDLEEFLKTNKLTTNLQKSIEQYASASMEESKERLEHFKESFVDIYVVEI